MIIQNINSTSSFARTLTIEPKHTLQSQKSDQINGEKKRLSIQKMEKQLSSTQLKTQHKDGKELFKAVQNTPVQQPGQFKISKSSSQPRMRTFKQQILRIPKVKQILQKDKFVYQQDIQKRLQLIGDVKNQNYTSVEIIKLKEMNKPVVVEKKKNRRHKTNFKIPLTRQNINSLNNLIQGHIAQNQHFKNEEFVYLSQKDYKQPFDLKKLKFMDQINPLKKKYKQKFPDLKEGVLSKNKLLLEHVILNRNVKREMNLDEKRTKKELTQAQGLILEEVKSNNKTKGGLIH